MDSERTDKEGKSEKISVVRVLTLFDTLWLGIIVVCLIKFIDINLQETVFHLLYGNSPTHNSKWLLMLPFIVGAPLAAVALLMAARKPFQLIPVCINSLCFGVYSFLWFHWPLNH